MIFGQENPTPHNHQPCDGPDYEGCPACIEHDTFMHLLQMERRQ